MGNYQQDQDEYLRLLRKYWDDEQYLDWAETLARVAPDVAIAHLSGPGIAVAVAVGGAGAGALAGAAFGPIGMIVGAAAGYGAGAYAGYRLAVKFENWYWASSTEDRARVQALGLKVAKGGALVWGVGSKGRGFFKSTGFEPA